MTDEMLEVVYHHAAQYVARHGRPTPGSPEHERELLLDEVSRLRQRRGPDETWLAAARGRLERFAAHQWDYSWEEAVQICRDAQLLLAELDCAHGVLHDLLTFDAVGAAYEQGAAEERLAVEQILLELVRQLDGRAREAGAFDEPENQRWCQRGRDCCQMVLNRIADRDRAADALPPATARLETRRQNLRIAHLRDVLLGLERLSRQSRHDARFQRRVAAALAWLEITDGRRGGGIPPEANPADDGNADFAPPVA